MLRELYNHNFNNGNNYDHNSYDNRKATNNRGNVIFSMSTMHDLAHDNPVFNRYIYRDHFDINTYDDNSRVNDNRNNNPYDNRNVNNNRRINDISYNKKDIREANNSSYHNDDNKGNIIFSMPSVYNLAHDYPVINRYAYYHPFNINSYDNGNNSRVNNNCNNNPYDSRNANNNRRINNNSNNNFHGIENANNNSHSNNNNKGNIVLSMPAVCNIAHDNPVFNRYIYCHHFKVNTYNNKRGVNNSPHDNKSANNSCRDNNISNNNNFHGKENANNNSYSNNNNEGNIVLSMPSVYNTAHDNPFFNRYIYCRHFNVDTYNNKRGVNNNSNNSPYHNKSANNSCRVSNISNNNNFHGKEKANDNSHDNDNNRENLISSMPSMHNFAHDNSVLHRCIYCHHFNIR
ncbi:unnamed protein product [Haemonchus placei]|uniref:GATA-type domain-containing protein n=1 Tax=Haemonchus placei TaxID=6290 RepID=A0A0N4WEU3_HAEPC|nr:unnamed protein product [Haemonchus placei]